jgi:hypothetical protein
MASEQELPFVDEHVRVVRAGQALTWTALQEYVEGQTSASHGVLSLLLGTVPRSGFEVVATAPPARSCSAATIGSRRIASSSGSSPTTSGHA